MKIEFGSPSADTAGYVAVWFIGDYACKPADTREKQLTLIEEKNRIVDKFASHLHATSYGA